MCYYVYCIWHIFTSTFVSVTGNNDELCVTSTPTPTPTPTSELHTSVPLTSSDNIICWLCSAPFDLHQHWQSHCQIELLQVTDRLSFFLIAELLLDLALILFNSENMLIPKIDF